jgi:multidrug transporter EmrE-like cation transporter
MSTPLSSVLLYLVAALVGALGQYMYKLGAQELRLGDAASVATNWRLLVGVICYVTVMALFVAALRLGGQLTVLYPIYATTFIWGALIGVYLLGESLHPLNVLGILLMVAGVALVAR